MTGKVQGTKVRESHILLTKYVSAYTRVHGEKPRFNRYSAKWGMIDVIDSVGVERAEELINYYFHTGSDHSIEFFYRNYDKLDRSLSQISEDRRRRAIIMESTRQRVEEVRDQ